MARRILLLTIACVLPGLMGCAAKCCCRGDEPGQTKETEVTVEVRETETTTETKIVDPGD